MDDNSLSISAEMWKVLSQTIEQVWIAVNDIERVKAILLQMQLPFIDNEHISLREIEQTWKEHHKQIIWETQQDNKTRLSFELIKNSLEDSTLLHLGILYQCLNKNPTYSTELNNKCKEINELLPGILFGPSNTIISYESIQIHCNMKDLFEFISSWNFAKVPHSLINEVKFISKQPNELNAIIQCKCKNGSIHYYQVAEVDFSPSQLITKYSIKEVDYKDKDREEEAKNTVPSNISIDSHLINFLLGQSDSNNSFLSVEHQFTYNKIELSDYQRSISHLIKDKKCMLLEIKNHLEAKLNRKKMQNSLDKKSKPK